MNSWSTRTDYSWYHLELDPSRYGQWSEMLTVGCKLKLLIDKMLPHLDSINFNTRGVYFKTSQGPNNQHWLASSRIGH